VDTKGKRRRRTRVNSFRDQARYLEKLLFDLDDSKRRFIETGIEEPTKVLFDRVKAAGYINMILAGVLEKRDNTERWEKQLLQLEGIIADLNAQLQEARAGQRIR
jgi:hypothetical protein